MFRNLKLIQLRNFRDQPMYLLNWVNISTWRFSIHFQKRIRMNAFVDLVDPPFCLGISWTQHLRKVLLITNWLFSKCSEHSLLNTLLFCCLSNRGQSYLTIFSLNFCPLGSERNSLCLVQMLNYSQKLRTEPLLWKNSSKRNLIIQHYQNAYPTAVSTDAASHWLVLHLWCYIVGKVKGGNQTAGKATFGRRVIKITKKW